MSNKTVTFDPSKYKLVPVEPSNESCGVLKIHADGYLSNIGAYRDMLAAVPDQLPGVMVHSGEPVFQVRNDIERCNGLWIGNLPNHETLLYTHPAPSQPRSQNDQIEIETLQHGIRQLNRRIAELEAKLEVDSRHSYDGIDCRNVTIKMLEDQLASQPSAEALVQAALEAALDAVQNVEINCDASGAAIGSAERRIRTLDKQQIIESVKS